jgi:(2Fe-2S) ferredoxin
MEGQAAPYRRVIMVCVRERDGGEAACGSRGSEKLLERLKLYVKEHGLKRAVRVCSTGCLDQCALGPNVVVMPDNVWLKGCSAADAETIIERWLAPLERELAERGS